MASLRDEHADATREGILAVARTTFAIDGFHAATVAEIAKRARVTTGALYHHFSNKKELFRAVVHLVMADLMAVANGSIDDAEPLDALKRVLHSVLDRARTVDVRIAFIEAPTVLGLEDWRDIEKSYATQTLKDLLEALIERGTIRPRPVDVLAAVLRGAINEAAMVVAETPQSDEVRKQAGDLLDAILDGLC